MGASWLHLLSLFVAVVERGSEQRESFHKDHIRHPLTEMMARGLTTDEEGWHMMMNHG